MCLPCDVVLVVVSFQPLHLNKYLIIISYKHLIMQYDATDAIVNSIIAQRIVTLYAREQYISTS